MATMTATASSTGAGTRAMPVRPYKDFLTPALHRRFTNAALLGLLACWTEATLMSKPSLFWSWFPFGFTGIRTLLLFVSSLTIFILRVAQAHVGEQTTSSPFDTVWQYVFNRKALQTSLWYTMSAFLFCEIYIFSASDSANLAWIDPGRSYERARLNERPVMFRSLFLCLAVARAGTHLLRDDDQIVVPTKERTAVQKPMEETSQPAAMRLLQRVQGPALIVVQRALTLTILVSLAGPFVYFVILRKPAWSIAFSIGKVLYTLPKYSKPSGLVDVFALFGRFGVASFMLSLLWEISNKAFTACASDEPLKKGLPLTNDSKDPNGTLIAGLKARKELPRNMAFWELALISTRFEDRRRTIYQEHSRQGGSSWSQVSSLCLAEIQKINQRIQGPPQAPPQNAGSEQYAQPLPKLTQPLRQDSIALSSAKPASTMNAFATGVGSMAKSVGQSPGTNPVGTRARKLLEYGSQKAGTQDQPQQQGQSVQQSMTQQANAYLTMVLNSPLGAFFQKTFARRIKAIIFGSPYSSASNIHHAIRALSQLTVCSYTEDTPGAVQNDIANIIKTLTTTIRNVQTLIQTQQPHFTDVNFDGKRQVKEVDELLDELRGGLEKILLTFGEYADGLGLSRTDLRQAKEAVNRGTEMTMAKSK